MLSQYQLNENVAQAGDFLLDYLSYHLRDQFDKSWLCGSRSQLWNIENKLLEKLGVNNHELSHFFKKEDGITKK